MKYKLVEIFESMQGEGRNSGRRCVFVRFAGCNLNCSWCDTRIECDFELTLDELIGEISSYRSKSVILTGGEPTIVSNVDELVAKLKSLGYWIAVETNGTSNFDDAPWLAFVDYIACSPKVEYPNDIRLERADEVRVVASVPGVAEFCRALSINATDYYISPCERDGAFDFETAKDALNELDGWALSVQLHKLLGFR